MPHIANTPESLLPRTDSLNPSTTCKGTTANGRPCRRPLASPIDSSSSAKHARACPTELYCWQHKDQAVSIHQETNNGPNKPEMKPRSSIDTLMERLGVLDINDAEEVKKRRQQRKKKQKKRTICCCFEVIEEEDIVLPRPVHPTPDRPQMQQLSPKAQKPSLSVSQDPSTSQTNPLLQWIPPSVSPETSLVLLTEMTKPISYADEPGYIYMFWATPSQTSRSTPPPADVVSSLFPPPSGHPRRVSDALRTARDLNTFTTNPTNSSPGTLRLKIGRTSNVQRRLNEWTRQCSHDLTLIRYYPYTPSSPQPSPAWHDRRSRPGLERGRKVRHVHRVERLIHLELADIKARNLGRCDDCGKEHREWFEVPADKTSLKRVDNCIRRWVKWAEDHA
ncbi:hypothetical protein EYZ11_003079 [Aspergillus tanneri]|uniref:Bacteriophage T5 Orf172 DNA-binding domain-containing protein n=1 Tax=Aspergillus tanneri TaxID=1220188 RepID=A0A4S3JPT6_9EURO|nr:uncharacterized protein ATNIH1004_010792 [Aspergillus tanneri]KAA8641853.1 hypothetical protein ATNIH1004_010792 [Aspergillus tanneri]THC97430.1 hypothetical protein EYZ11_003079 [Aspergillus tanneri]